MVSDKRAPNPTSPVVLHVITGLARGGTEARLARLVGAATRLRHMVAVLTPAMDLAPAFAQLGVRVVPLGLSHPLGLPLAVLRLRRLIQHERPCLVQSWLWHSDLAATLATRSLGTVSGDGRPALAWALCGSDVELSRQALATRLTLRACARLSHLPDLVLSNSEAGLAAHREAGYRPRRSLVLPNGHDLERFRPDPDSDVRLRASLGWPQDTELVGMFARAAPMKDHATLLEALQLLVQRRPRLRCVLAGSGTEHLAVPPALEPVVARLGPVADPAPLLAGLDVNLLSSSHGEGSPNILGEAMASGVASVATDVGDAKRLLLWPGGAAGRIVPPRDPAAFAAAVDALLALEPAARRALGAAGRARIEQHFAIGPIAARHERVWLALCQGESAAWPWDDEEPGPDAPAEEPHPLGMDRTAMDGLATDARETDGTSRREQTEPPHLLAQDGARYPATDAEDGARRAPAVPAAGLPLPNHAALDSLLPPTHAKLTQAERAAAAAPQEDRSP